MQNLKVKNMKEKSKLRTTSRHCLLMNFLAFAFCSTPPSTFNLLFLLWHLDFSSNPLISMYFQATFFNLTFGGGQKMCTSTPTMIHMPTRCNFTIPNRIKSFATKWTIVYIEHGLIHIYKSYY